MPVIPSSTKLGQLLSQASVGARLKVLLGLLQPAESQRPSWRLGHHTPRMSVRRKPAVFHKRKMTHSPGRRWCLPRLGKSRPPVQDQCVMLVSSLIKVSGRRHAHFLWPTGVRQRLQRLTSPEGAAAQRASSPAVRLADRWPCGKSHYRRVQPRLVLLPEESQRTRRAWLPALWLGAARYQLLIGCNSSSYTDDPWSITSDDFTGNLFKILFHLLKFCSTAAARRSWALPLPLLLRNSSCRITQSVHPAA